MVRGTNSFNRGDYQTANIRYLQVPSEIGLEPWVAYNLGVVYFSLGEVKAAEREWNQAIEGESQNLLYRSYFNRGVLYYVSGLYDDAYRDFRKALEIYPAGKEAKINLEFCLEKISAKAQAETLAPDLSQPVGSNSGEIDRILNYLRGVEEQVWQSTEQIEEVADPQDW